MTESPFPFEARSALVLLDEAVVRGSRDVSKLSSLVPNQRRSEAKDFLLVKP